MFTVSSQAALSWLRTTRIIVLSALGTMFTFTAHSVLASRVSIAAADTVTISATPTTVNIGDMITVTVGLTGTTSFVATSVPLYFDTSKFELFDWPALAIMRGTIVQKNPNGILSLGKASKASINALGAFEPAIFDFQVEPENAYVGDGSLAVFMLRAKAVGIGQIRTEGFSATNAFGIRLESLSRNSIVPKIPQPISVMVMGEPSQPEIDITRSASAIIDNSIDTVVGSRAALATSLRYAITNSGTANLSIGNFSIAGETNCTATVTTHPATTIAAAGVSTLMVTVTPTTAGAWSFTLSSATNDSNENPYNWTVGGSANLATSILSSMVFMVEGPVPVGVTAVTVNDGSGARPATLTDSGVGRMWSATAAKTATALTVTMIAADASTKSRTFTLIPP